MSSSDLVPLQQASGLGGPLNKMDKYPSRRKHMDEMNAITKKTFVDYRYAVFGGSAVCPSRLGSKKLSGW